MVFPLIKQVPLSKEYSYETTRKVKTTPCSLKEIPRASSPCSVMGKAKEVCMFYGWRWHVVMCAKEKIKTKMGRDGKGGFAICLNEVLGLVQPWELLCSSPSPAQGHEGAPPLLWLSHSLWRGCQTPWDGPQTQLLHLRMLFFHSYLGHWKGVFCGFF